MDKIWAKMIFWLWPRNFDFARFLQTSALNFEESYASDKASLYFYSHQESCLGLESNPWSSVAICHMSLCLSGASCPIWKDEDHQNCPVCQSSPIWLSEEFCESNYFRIEQRVVLLHILIFVLADCRIIKGQDKKKKIKNMFSLFWFWPQPIATHETDIQICLCPGLYSTSFSYISPPLSRIN